jgi:hypothetical protein
MRRGKKNIRKEESKALTQQTFGMILILVGVLITLGSLYRVIVTFTLYIIDISHYLRTAFYLAIGILLLILSFRLIKLKEKKKSVNILFFGGLGVLVLWGLWHGVRANEPEINHLLNIVESTHLPTNTPLPTKTPIPTSTPRPTATITPTPWPNLISCATIYKEKESFTDLQWQEYKDQVKGMNIRFFGKVLQVYSDASIELEYDNVCERTLYKVPYKIAATLSKGDLLEGYGTISKVYDLLGLLMVEINVYPATLIMQ